MTGALIVTAELPPDLHRWATRLRSTHYPPERNVLEAHVTLFHALPPGAEAELSGRLAGMTAEYAPVAALLDGIMSLGGGTALRLVSPGMLMLRRQLAEELHGLLSAQDQAEPRLHITIQNKVSNRVAKELQMALMAQIEPREFRFTGLAMHRYRGGPWDLVRRWPFRGKSEVDRASSRP